MTSHPHLLVFINSFTKNFMFLGLTSVDFYHPYTDLEYGRNTVIKENISTCVVDFEPFSPSNGPDFSSVAIKNLTNVEINERKKYS